MSYETAMGASMMQVPDGFDTAHVVEEPQMFSNTAARDVFDIYGGEVVEANSQRALRRGLFIVGALTVVGACAGGVFLWKRSRG